MNTRDQRNLTFLLGLVATTSAFAQTESNYYPAELRQSCAVKRHAADYFDWRAQLESEVNQALSVDRSRQIAVPLKGLEQYSISVKNKMSKDKTEWTNKIAQDLSLRLQSPEFKAKLTEVATNKICAKGTTFNFQLLNGLLAVRKTTTETQDTIRQIEAIGDKAILCSKPMALRSVLKDLPEQGSVDLSGTSFFNDNAMTLTAEQEVAFSSRIEAELLKYKKLNCVTRINSIEVLTSANYKPNNEKIGRFNFLELSTRRAEFLKSSITNTLQKLATDHQFKLATDTSKLVSVNALGENGDGTSGPCPYRIENKNGRMTVLKDETIWNSEAMTKARFGRVSFEISYEGNQCGQKAQNADERVQDYFGATCAIVDVSCK